MNDQQWNKVKELFAAAQELPAAQRLPFLLQACGEDHAVRMEVESLLAEADTDSATSEGILHIDGRGEPSASDSIGPYKLLQLIGEGGMGEVWQVEQTHPIRRIVALKLIKLGMDSRAVIARFEQERQALAMMNHPNVAKVLDAGTTNNGRPYFVMEHVPGEPITVFCDRHKYTTRQRLELFMQACEAIQHAHQKAIIHRDLKPSNLLVMLQDNKPVVKVIDFGVAKATAQKLTERTLFTQSGELVGTPEYMSPEQAEMSAVDVDTRSDIYSLGVLMYELLTGVTPFDRNKLRSGAYHEMQRIIREVEPPRPSTRLSQLDVLPAVADQRRADPKRLQQAVRGDLDWIVMRCLEKDRSRRYDSADALGQDIGRYLTDQPVLAGRPSRAYRVRKMIRRNRGAFVTALAFVLVLASATAVSVRKAIVATRAERIAEAARASEQNERSLAEAARIAEQQQRNRAEANAARADREATNALDQSARSRAVDQFLNNLLDAVAARNELDEASDSSVQPDSPFLRALDRAAGNISAKNTPPDVRAHLHMTIGRTYQAFRDYTDAERHYRTAVQVRRELAPTVGDAELGDMIQALGQVVYLNKKVDESIELYNESLSIRRCVLEPDHPDIAMSLAKLAGVLRGARRHTEAEACYRESLKIWDSVRNVDHWRRHDTRWRLGAVLADQRRFDEAEPMLLDGYMGLRDHLNAPAVNIRSSIRTLIALYELWQRPDDAQKWRATLSQFENSRRASTTQPAARTTSRPRS